MITCVTGMPGSGKSYFLTYQAYKAMKEERLVFSNFFIKGAYQITLEDICNYSFPMGCLVICDEAGRWFNSRSWKDLPPDIFDLFTMHRHMQLDLLVGVQNFARIDKSLREVIELTYWSSNPWLLPFHIYRGYYDLEKVGAMKEHDRLTLVPKSKKIRKLYDTHSMKSAWEDKEEIPLNLWEYDEEPKLSLLDRLKLKFRKDDLEDNDIF